ncbi:MAG: hypothetical protein HC902_09350, partial [Calothrix sp. SM1_5_4]|nr:hypothetical protein [Calothrix sp. SM1_5_4]
YVQPNLKLGVQYNYNFDFRLKARTMNSSAQRVPDGMYQLTVAIVRKDSPSTYPGDARRITP